MSDVIPGKKKKKKPWQIPKKCKQRKLIPNSRNLYETFVGQLCSQHGLRLHNSESFPPSPASDMQITDIRAKTSSTVCQSLYSPISNLRHEHAVGSWETFLDLSASECRNMISYLKDIMSWNNSKWIRRLIFGQSFSCSWSSLECDWSDYKVATKTKTLQIEITPERLHWSIASCWRKNLRSRTLW